MDVNLGLSSVPARWVILTTALTCWSGGGAASELFADPVNFTREIAPILERHCLRCHNDATSKGDVSLSTRKPAMESGTIVPSDAASSSLLDAVRSQDGQPPRMPQEGPPLRTEQVELLTRWIELGADWPEGARLEEPAGGDGAWWSLQPIRPQRPPVVEGLSDWAQSPIDRFIAAAWGARDLSPAAPASRQTLIRRATYDLTGLPPSPEEVEAFVADPSPDAWPRLVDRLLASPAYGERWGRHWLDVVRFGESNGFERNEIWNNAWPFRDYVIRSFNEDKPFDRLVKEHLAGDVLAGEDRQVAVGTGFLVCGPYDDVGNQDPVQAAQIRANTIDEVIRTTAEGFLGLTIGCARCHSHKFDPIRQRDYYALYATFAGVKHGSRVIATAEEQASRDQQLQPLQEQVARLAEEEKTLRAAIAARAEANAAVHEGQWTRPVASRYGTEETFEPVAARSIRLIALSRDDNPQARTGFGIDEFEVWTAEESPRNVALATSGGTATGTSRVAEDFAGAYGPELTIDGQFGARWIASGPELTVTFAQPERINRVYFSSDRLELLEKHRKTIFVGDYRIEASLDGEHWTEVASSEDRQPPTPAHRRERLVALETAPEERERLGIISRETARANAAVAAVPALPAWWVGQFQPAAGPFPVFLGGDPQKPGEAVVPAALSVLRDRASYYELPPETEESARRMALASWIMAEDNPLTARVLANRVWHYHFGVGIVASPSDFGAMGQPPTHPELLDWLATELQRSGWSIKHLQREILLSATYQQSSAYRESQASMDAESRYLWRFPPRRFSAEEVRDTMLSIAGELNRSMGGPGFRLYRYLQDNVATYVPLDEHGPETYRRAVYHQNARAARTDLMTDFDCPDNSFAAPRRAQTTTPLQVLTLMNHSFPLAVSEALARRVERDAGAEAMDQTRRVFWLTYSRAATPDEEAAAAELVRAHGLRALCRALLNSNEFITLD